MSVTVWRVKKTCLGSLLRGRSEAWLSGSSVKVSQARLRAAIPNSRMRSFEPPTARARTRSAAEPQ